MICWNCGATVPETAKRCSKCEAEVEHFSPEDIALAEELFQALPGEVQDAIASVFQEAGSGEEALRILFVGDCPRCGSQNTQDCDGDPDLEDITVGRCLECGQYWCTNCGELFADAHSTEHDCSFWKELEETEDELDEFDHLTGDDESPQNQDRGFVP
ncbi:MAG: hypothetical protein GXP27_11295 [Planctomycetes bacterium]|nr:hypothetical protein [Planctomycetota bacterium]